jgi:hypothetical protein
VNDSATLVAQLEHAALIGGFERTLLRDAAARIAELEAEVGRLTAASVDALFRSSTIPQDEGDRSNDVVGGRRIAELEAEQYKLRGELALLRLAYASVITERDRIKAALREAAEWIGTSDIETALPLMRAALSGEGVT